MHDGGSATARAALATLAACPADRAAALEVHPPPGFAVKPIPEDGAYAAEYEVSSTSDDSFGRQIGFDPSKAMAAAGHTRINRAAVGSGFAALADASIAPLLDIERTEPFSTQGVSGLAMTGVPKGGAGQVRSLLLFQTPRGRTTVPCASPPARFDALRPTFVRVARGVALPRLPVTARPPMNDRSARRPALVALVALLCCAPAAAPCAAMTALTVHPPEGFTVRQSTPDADDDTGYEVQAASDPDVGCQVNLTDTRHPRDRYQSALNREAAEPGYLDRVRAGLAGHFEVQDVAPFSTQGADGSVATAEPKGADGAARAAIFDVETPRGNLEILCVSSPEEFDAWRPLFERIARGVDLPR